MPETRTFSQVPQVSMVESCGKLKKITVAVSKILHVLPLQAKC